MRHTFYFCCLILAPAILVMSAGCDTGISGDLIENQPPNTELSVRDSSLVDNIPESERLSSTVFVSWSGIDPDGYVASYEMRYYDSGDVFDLETGWISTTSSDTLLLMPIPRGERVANVIFEVRAIDNEGLKDPEPARSVFPIQNAPPTIRISNFELPPDTTFSIFSFAWIADDPEGDDNLNRIEVSFNDSLNFVALPPEIEFATFVGNVNRDDPGQTVTEARVYAGRAFQRTQIDVPGLLMDADNTFYVRAVDLTDTTSTRQEYTWYVKKPKGEVLYVNDFRKVTSPIIQRFHLELLREYLSADTDIDIWDISNPPITGTAGNVPRSDALPPSADPTLRQMMTLYDYIYWVSTNTVSSIGGNNLPFAAGVMDLFFEEGGKMMVHSPMIQPQDPENNLGNPAILLLPLSDLLVRPDSLQRLELGRGAQISPVQPLPGIDEALPPLTSTKFFISELPYYAEGNNIVPLYEAEYDYLTRTGRRGTWPGPNVVASISADRRVGLFALPLVSEQSGDPVLLGADDNPDTVRQVVMLMLESLGFPKR